MSLVDFLAFIAAMIFLIVSSRQTAKRRKEQPLDTGDTFEEHGEALIREEFMFGKKDHKGSLPSNASKGEHERHRSVKGEKKAAKATASSAYRLSDKETGQRESDVFSEIRQSAANAYALTKHDKNSKAWSLVHQLKSTKKMALLHDIFGPPKGLS